ncbi:MAG: hypothetical protein JWL90_152 [Chthoniobacteraceae bacterium]|nr:hypothetical protein [Chthoniobacteraceae bacterium]
MARTVCRAQGRIRVRRLEDWAATGLRRLERFDGKGRFSVVVFMAPTIMQLPVQSEARGTGELGL